MSIPPSITKLFKPDPDPIRQLIEPDPDRPDLEAIRPRPTFAAWRAKGAPGTGRGADLDGSHEPGLPGGQSFAGQSSWHAWLFRGKP